MDQSKNKITLFSFILCLFLVGGVGWAGFQYGKTVVCSEKVLGLQSDSLLGSKLLSLLKFNIERPSEFFNQFQISGDQNNSGQIQNVEPSPEEVFEDIIATPLPNPSESPSMIWGGTKREKPSPVPTPFDTTENDRINGDNRKQKATPDPTPDYYYKPGRNNANTSPSPKIVATDQIKQIISENGIELEKPEITKGAGDKEINVTGIVKDKLFGFLPVSFPVVVVVDSDSGEVTKMQLPWWRSLFGNKNWGGGAVQVRCGDGVCSVPIETNSNCPYDCTGAVCGNSICEYGEGINNCSADCINVGIPQ